MGKKDDEKTDDTDPCPPPPGGCGGSGIVIDNFNGQRKKSDCFTCHGSGRIPKQN